MSTKIKPPAFRDTLGKRDTVKNMIKMQMTLSEIVLAIGCTREELSIYYGDLLEKHSPLEHIPTEEDRQIVWRSVAYGIPRAEIASRLGISEDTLRVHYSQELRNAKAEWTDRVASSLQTQAVNGNVPAAIFLLKARAGWKETAVNELVGPNGQPLTATINVTVGGGAGGPTPQGAAESPPLLSRETSD